MVNIFFYSNLYCLFSVFCSACEPKVLSCPIEAEYDLIKLDVIYLRFVKVTYVGILHNHSFISDS